MSLTKDDLQQIRTIVRDEVHDEVRSAIATEINPRLEVLGNEIKAIHNDIKEIYDMIADLQGRSITEKDFQKLSMEDKLLRINAELLAAAKQAGVSLPRS